MLNRHSRNNLSMAWAGFFHCLSICTSLQLWSQAWGTIGPPIVVGLHIPSAAAIGSDGWAWWELESHINCRATGSPHLNWAVRLAGYTRGEARRLVNGTSFSLMTWMAIISPQHFAKYGGGYKGNCVDRHPVLQRLPRPPFTSESVGSCISLGTPPNFPLLRTNGIALFKNCTS